MDSSAGKLSGYIGTWDSRFHFLPWAMVGLYLAAFIVPGPATLITAYGLWNFLRAPREKLLGPWMLSLLLFYLLWFGVGPNSQNYYNLPALAPLCALFGIGMTSILEWQMLLRWRRPWRSLRLCGGAASHPYLPIPFQTRSPDSGSCPLDKREYPTRRCHSFPTDSPVGYDRASLQSSAGILFGTPNLRVDCNYTRAVPPHGHGTSTLRSRNSASIVRTRRIAQRLKSVSREQPSSTRIIGLAGGVRLSSVRHGKRLCRLPKKLDPQMLKRLLSKLHAPVYRKRLDVLTGLLLPHLRDGDAVLDVGCGSGQLGIELDGTSQRKK